MELFLPDQLGTDLLDILLFVPIILHLLLLVKTHLSFLDLFLDLENFGNLDHLAGMSILHHLLQLLLIVSLGVIMAPLVDIGKLLFVVALDEHVLLPLMPGSGPELLDLLRFGPTVLGDLG